MVAAMLGRYWVLFICLAKSHATNTTEAQLLVAPAAFRMSKKSLSQALIAFQVVTILAQVVLWAYEALYTSILTRSNRVLPVLSKSTRRGCVAIVPIFCILDFALYAIQILVEAYNASSSCYLSVDNDATGIGIRAALYAFGGLSGIIAIMGHFHAEKSGALELGVILWFSVLVNIVNLVKSYFTASSPVTILLETVMLDAYISALSITLAMKECLAQKWRVISTVILQALGIILEAAAIGTISSLQSSQSPSPNHSECACFEMVWWGHISTCTGASPIFWLYFCIRTAAWLHEAWLAFCNMGQYSRAKKASSDDGKRGQNGDDNIPACVYDSIPATAFSSYILSLIDFLSASVSIEVSLKVYHRQDNALLRTWGQTAQLMAALWSVYCWTEQARRMFTVKSIERRRAILARCCIGSRIPALGSIESIDPKNPVWKAAVLWLSRAIHNHPFGTLPPRRLSDHARFCDTSIGWQKIELDFRQWPTASENDKGELLLAGAKQGDKTLVSSLLVESAPINTVDTDGYTALRLSINMDHFSITNMLLAAGADSNIPDLTKKTPLHVVSERGNEEAANMLLDNGAQLNLANIDGLTSLHYAARRGQAKLVNLLLLKGADPDAKDFKGRSALNLLLRHGHEGMVDFLASKANPNLFNGKGKTPLYIAARYEREDGAAALLKHGADPNITDFSRGYTPLHICARYSRPGVAELLLKSGCDSSVVAKHELRTALHLAATFGREKVVDHLIRFGTDLDAIDHHNRTALFYAAKDDRDATRKLLRKGAKVRIGESWMLQNLLTKYGISDEDAGRLIAEESNDRILEILEN
jgi:ankyrin repeat protein